MPQLPKITIITVCYNCIDTIESTLQNVLKQTYSNVEYIVIDGNSTDGTREVIDRYADRLAYSVSEPDKGIYDAMNKGISKATGEWIIFRNAGDYFFSHTTLSDVFTGYEDKGEALIVGGMRCFSREGFRDAFYQPASDDVWQQAHLPHPATFIRTKIQKSHLYATKYRIASDYRFFQQLRLEGMEVAYYKGLVTLFDNEMGISSTRLALSWKELLLIREELGAPREVRSETRKRYWHIRLLQPITRLLNHFLWYRNRHQPADWVEQPLSLTLKHI